MSSPPAASPGRIHYRTCNLCEALCGIAVEVEGGRVRSIRGDEDDPFSRGHLCPKAVALKDVHEDPDRLRRPLLRTGTGWREASWEEALDAAAAGLHAVQEGHGRDALATFIGNPAFHHHGLLLHELFRRNVGTRNAYSSTSTDQLPHMLAGLLVFGHQLLLPVPDVDRTSFFLMLGANPLVSNGSIMSAPGIKRRLQALLARGGRLVVVDPRRTETAALASQHLPIRPGTDALLLLALLHTILAEGLARPGRLAGFTDGLDAVAAAAAPFTPERVAEATGVGAEEMRALARAFAGAPSAVAYGRVGVSTQPFGGLCQWLLVVLNVVTGNLDREGGAMFALPAADLLPFARRAGLQGSFARWHSRVRGLPEFGGELPAAALAEEMDTPGPGQVRGLITVASNPALSVPNGGRLRRALAGLEFMVSVDFYLNETTRHAHVVLPPTSALERDHYDAAFHLLAVRNTAKYSPPVFPRAEGARDDWQILLELGAGLQARRGHRLRAAALRRGVGALGPTGLVAWLLRTGPYGPGLIPFARGLTLARLKQAPHGVDLGPLRPCLPGRLPAGWKRIRLAPAPFIEDVERLRRSLDTGANGLVLVGRRDLRSNNSWMHNSERLTKGRDRCTLLMHPGDAAARGLADGARVQVRSRVGAVEVALEVTEAMRPGVVCLPHGYGHDQPGVRLRVAAARPGASVNDLNDEARVDELSGTAAFSALPVDVTALRPPEPTCAGGDLPPLAE